MIRKEAYVHKAVMEELRRIIEDSEVMAEDDALWDARSWRLSLETSTFPSPLQRSDPSSTSTDPGTQTDLGASTTWSKISSVWCSASSAFTSRSNPSKRGPLILAYSYRFSFVCLSHLQPAIFTFNAFNL